jgi:hypothetical protein
MIQTVPLAVRIGWAYACAGNMETALTRLCEEADDATSNHLAGALAALSDAAGLIEQAQKSAAEAEGKT